MLNCKIIQKGDKHCELSVSGALIAASFSLLNHQISLIEGDKYIILFQESIWTPKYISN